MACELRISQNMRISAIYYALLQSGYEYAHLDRDVKHTEALAAFAYEEGFPFFDGVRQSSCEVYPYWPRAALLETASFHVADESPIFREKAVLQRKIMSMSNVANAERDESFWMWLADFPPVLHEVLKNTHFLRYLEWEKTWIDQQNTLHAEALKRIARCVEICAEKYRSPMWQIRMVINPIKCVYSADYHLQGECFVFTSGRLQETSVIHEFLHHVVHPVVVQHRELIMQDDRLYPGIDASYYEAGRLNAFEEHLVRELTQRAMQDALPDNLPAFLHTLR